MTRRDAAPSTSAIADAIRNTCEVAAVDLKLHRQAEIAGFIEDVPEPYLRLASMLDAAGLIDWSAIR